MQSCPPLELVELLEGVSMKYEYRKATSSLGSLRRSRFGSCVIRPPGIAVQNLVTPRVLCVF